MIINLNFFFFPFQIRSEKPYYIADPEVDSLVSRTTEYWVCQEEQVKNKKNRI